MFDRVATSKGIKVNPTTGTELAVTPILPSGVWQLTFVVSANAAATVDYYQMSPDGATPIFGQTLYIGTANPKVITLSLLISTNEFVKLLMGANLTGSICGSLVGLKVR